MTYELFQLGPTAYIPVLLVSLIITLVKYGAFPLIFSKIRRKIITQKQYILLCYVVNFLVYIVFAAVNNETTSCAPCFLWTGIFSAAGISTLKTRCILDGFQYTNPTDTNIIQNETEYLTNDIAHQGKKTTSAENKQNRFCLRCGHLLPENSIFCQHCGIQLECTEIPFSSVKNPECKERYFSSKVKYSLIVISTLLILSGCLNVVLYLENSKITASQEAQINELEKNINSLNTTVSTQKEQINSQKNTITSLKVKEQYFDQICYELSSGNIGYASNNFKSNESIIVVGLNETNRKFTLTANWSNGGNVSTDYSGRAASVSFDNSSWYTSTKMTITPNYTGVTAVTFRNDVNSDTFKVLIIVVD